MRRAKTLTHLLVIFGLVAGAMWLATGRSKRSFPNPTVAIRRSQEIAEPRTSPPPNAVTSLAVGFRPPPTPAASPVEPTLRELCLADWQRIAATNELDLRRDLENGRSFLFEPCLLRMKKEIRAPVIQNFVIACQLEIEAKDFDAIVRDCESRLPIFRAFVIRQLYDDTVDLVTLDIADLANQLLGGFVDIRDAPEATIQRNIQIADALIDKSPDYYPAYKAKLLNLLIEELKFKRPEDLATYQDLYDNLLSFRSENHQDRVLADARLLRGDSRVALETTGIDPDLVHIPFLRLAARGENRELAELASEYVAAYPKSPVGYFYLADAAWRSGDRAAAVNFLKVPLGEGASDTATLELLQRAETEKPLDRLMRMAPE